MEKLIPFREGSILSSLKEIGLSKEFIKELFGERWKEAVHDFHVDEIEYSLMREMGDRPGDESPRDEKLP